MSKITCECGHVNPYGTVLCESCGKPLQEEKTKEILTMRYEGSARRSQVYQRTIIDKIWNFFSSVKIGVSIIVVVLVASAIGTILPQEMYIPPNAIPDQFYQDEYGVAGQVYYQLGFHNLYGSWWYVVLLALLGTSIIVASIDRVIPLHRSLRHQKVTKHDRFLRRQRIFGVTAVPGNSTISNDVKSLLKKRHYKIREENGDLFAEKGRFSRWGPYVNHVGLILVLIGSMLRFFPGMYVDEVLWLRDGQTKKIPGTNGEYYLQSHKFIVETYDENNPKYEAALEEVEGPIVSNFQTNATLYQPKGEVIPGEQPELIKVKDHQIRVNQPLEFGDFAVYQVDYKLNEFKTMSFKLEDKETGKTFVEFTVNLYNPKSEYQLKNGYRVKMIAYFPDFYFNDEDEPATKSDIPNNPAFIFKMFTPETPKGEVAFVGIRKNLEPYGENEYKLSFSGIEVNNVTGLTVRKDHTLWILFAGAMIFLIGVAQGMYWNHRRIWLAQKDNEIWLAASTNKNWYGLKKEVRLITDQTSLSEPTDQLETKDSKKGMK